MSIQSRGEVGAVKMGEQIFSVRRFESGDKEKIINIVEKVWDQETSDRLKLLWDWKYEINPQNPPDGHKSLVLTLNGEPVGFLGYLSVDIKVGDTIEPMAWGSELSILPEYRGHGWLLLKYVTEHSEKICSGASIPRKIYLIYKKLGAVDVTQFVSLKKVIRGRRFFARKYPLPLAWVLAIALRTLQGLLRVLRWGPGQRRLKIEQISRFEPRFDQLWTEAAAGFDMITVRDTAFLNWRYFDIPNRAYEVFAATDGGQLRGYIVLRKEHRDGLERGYIVDMLAVRPDKATWSRLLDFAHKHFRAQGVDVVSFVCGLENQQLIADFRRNGFLIKTVKEKLIAHSGGTDYYRNLIPRFDHAEDYYLTRGDADTDYMN